MGKRRPAGASSPTRPSQGIPAAGGGRSGHPHNARASRRAPSGPSPGRSARGGMRDSPATRSPESMQTSARSQPPGSGQSGTSGIPVSGGEDIGPDRHRASDTPTPASTAVGMAHPHAHHGVGRIAGTPNYHGSPYRPGLRGDTGLRARERGLLAEGAKPCGRITQHLGDLGGGTVGLAASLANSGDGARSSDDITVSPSRSTCNTARSSTARMVSSRAYARTASHSVTSPRQARC